jgi:predicted XRE-type DNA-binding protein
MLGMRATGKTAKRKKMNAETIKVELGSGNVFADIGLKDADELLLKAKLVAKISQLIEKKGLTQAEIAKRTGLDQPKVSRLLNGQLSGFSADRLFAVLNRLGHSVEVRISVKERPPEKSHTRVMLA